MTDLAKLNPAYSQPLDVQLRWDERLARGISDVFSPPFIAISGIALTTTVIDAPAAWYWIAYYLILAVLVPITYLIWKVHRGEISDFHIQVREQRIRPLVLTLACSVTALGSLWAGQAPRMLQIFAGMGTLQITILLLVTLNWKISGHAAAMGSFAVFIWSLYGNIATPALLAIPLVAWARIRLHRHTPAQTFAGSLVGIVIMLATLELLAR